MPRRKHFSNYQKYIESKKVQSRKDVTEVLETGKMPVCEGWKQYNRDKWDEKNPNFKLITYPHKVRLALMQVGNQKLLLCEKCRKELEDLNSFLNRNKPTT